MHGIISETCARINQANFHRHMMIIHVSNAMPMPLPALAALRAFEAAARHLSFRRAAEELRITQSAVSHQIARLEEGLNTRLFRRLARRVELTEAGAQFYPFVREGFERLTQGTALLTRKGIAGDLTVQVYVTVAVRWLIPRLFGFQQDNPDLLVRLSTSHLDWEFDADTGDVGIIYTTRPNRARLHYAPLFKASLFPVCSPELALNLAEPSDLERQVLLQVYTASEDWRVWLAAAGLTTVGGRAAPTFDSYLLALEAAVEGQGVAVAPHFLVAADLRAGRLVRPFETKVEQPGGWFLVCRVERRAESAIVRFRDWLVAAVRGDPIIESLALPAPAT
jgi:LysR family glycine cleavage system transcriptional activator